MKRILTALVFSALVVGCSTDGKFKKTTFVSGPCGGSVTGHTTTIVRYGDGKIVVRPRSDIKPNSEWRFRLVPYDNLGGVPAYGDSDVTVDGKAAGDMVLNPAGTALVAYVIPGPPPVDDTWLSASGDFNSARTDRRGKRYIVACIPDDVQDRQDWYYSVEIDNVGKVDPRGRVER